MTQHCSGEDDVKDEGIVSFLLFNLNFSNVERSFHVYCKYNECNDEQTVTGLFNAFWEGYDVDQILGKFANDFIENNESSTTKQSKSTITVKPTNSVSTIKQSQSTSATTAFNTAQYIRSSSAIINLNLLLFVLKL